LDVFYELSELEDEQRQGRLQRPTTTDIWLEIELRRYWFSTDQSAGSAHAVFVSETIVQDAIIGPFSRGESLWPNWTGRKIPMQIGIEEGTLGTSTLTIQILLLIEEMVSQTFLEALSAQIFVEQSQPREEAGLGEADPGAGAAGDADDEDEESEEDEPQSLKYRPDWPSYRVAAAPGAA
jgi:hypothetical protein